MGLDSFKSEDEDKSLGQKINCIGDNKLYHNNSKEDNHKYNQSEWLNQQFDRMGVKRREKECHQCNSYFSRISAHWEASNCSYPNLSNYVKDLLTGILMSDGHLNRQHKSPHMMIKMVNLPFLKWFSDELEILSNGVHFSMTAKQSAMQNINSGFQSEAEWQNYADVYYLSTIAHPWLHELDWYTKCGKQFPDSLQLSDDIVKMWYCGDGNLKKDTPSMNITALNESDNFTLINNLFKEWGMPIDRIDKTNGKNSTLSFNKQKTYKLLDKIGPAVPGFEYKWCTGSKKQYKELYKLSRVTSHSEKSAIDKFNEFNMNKYKQKALEIGGFGGY